MRRSRYAPVAASQRRPRPEAWNLGFLGLPLWGAALYVCRPRPGLRRVLGKLTARRCDRRASGTTPAAEHADDDGKGPATRAARARALRDRDEADGARASVAQEDRR